MKKTHKLLIVFSLVLTCVFATSVNNNVYATDGILYVKHTANEFKEIINSDNNMATSEKRNLINKIETLEKRRANYSYWTIYSQCKVTDAYTCTPYFYTYSSFNTDGSPRSIEEVLYANINRTWNGTSKQFSGTLYYHLESKESLFWDLNGDFYNNGTTTVGGGIEIGIDEFVTLNFSISYSTNHYAYCHKSVRIRL